MNREALTRPFPHELLRQRQGHNGKSLTYVETWAVIDRLNEACDAWSFEVMEHQILGDELVVVGKLSADGVVKNGLRRFLAHTRPQRQQPVGRRRPEVRGKRRAEEGGEPPQRRPRAIPRLPARAGPGADRPGSVGAPAGLRRPAHGQPARRPALRGAPHRPRQRWPRPAGARPVREGGPAAPLQEGGEHHPRRAQRVKPRKRALTLPARACAELAPAQAGELLGTRQVAGELS
ncbi:MAG: hypothetical protein IPJ34_13435 [Myxococcales bacterium]|nr:hypothetical protein [Myxococcales bacterium]